MNSQTFTNGILSYRSGSLFVSQVTDYFIDGKVLLVDRAGFLIEEKYPLIEGVNSLYKEQTLS